jgi:hypothetical protein
MRANVNAGASFFCFCFWRAHKKHT